MAPPPPDDYAYDAFISYSSADSEWVRDWLLPRLEGAGLRVCIDFRDFDVGAASPDNMELAANSSRHMLLVLTPAWVRSEWTTFESLLVQITDPAARRRRILPLLLQPCRPPQRIAMLTYADFTDKRHRDDQFQRVLRAVRGELNLRDLGPSLEHLAGAGAPRSSLTSLHQLPAPLADFVGRAGEAERLVQAFSRPGASGLVAPIRGIRGMGGIGKTELAHLVAARLRDAFPDAQLLLDLRGAGAQPMTSAQALETIIRAFEPPAQLPNDLAQLGALYRSTLAGRRALIIADDAHDAVQVRPLLPPPGSALLITSRRRFALPGMETVELGVLPPGEAARLLLAICPRIDSHTARLAELCGRLPLALRVSASLLANNPARNVAHYVQSLEDERARLRNLHDPDDPTLNVEASIALSYKALKPVAKRTLCQLGVFPASFDFEAAARVVALPTPRQRDPGSGAARVEEALGLLYQCSLLDYDEKLQRYSLHDLVRSFAAARMGDDAGVRLRYARHYAEVAARTQRLFLEVGEQSVAGLALFDRERAHIDAGWAWARGRAGQPDTDDLQLRYADATSYIGELRYHPQRERILQLEAALLAAQRLGRRDAQGRFLGNLGLVYANLGEARLAIEFYEQTLEIMRVLSDRKGEGAILGNMGSVYYALDDARRAIELYEQALKILRASRDRRGESTALGGLGNVYSKLGEMQQALEFYAQALMIARVNGDRRNEGAALNSLGNAYADLGDAPRAIAFYEQSLEIARALGDQQGECNALGGLGNVYYKLEEMLQALEYYEQWREMARALGDRRSEGNALGNLGNTYYILGDVYRAIESYERQVGIARALGDRRGEAITSWNLGLRLEEQGDLVRAAAYMQTLVDFEREIGHTDAERYAARLEEVRRRLREAGEG